MVKNPPAVQETQVQSLGQEDPLEEEMATHASILAWRVPWTGYRPWGRRESDMILSVAVTAALTHDYCGHLPTREVTSFPLVGLQEPAFLEAPSSDRHTVGSQCMLSASVQKQAPVEGVNEPRSQALWFSVSEVKLRVSVVSQQASVRH